MFSIHSVGRLLSISRQIKHRNRGTFNNPSSYGLSLYSTFGSIKDSQNVNIEQHKPTPIQRRAQQEGIMAKKMLLYKYQLLKSEPTDNLHKIHHNFIYIKTQLSNRRYYVPDKKQYLMMLDQCYKDILAVHEDYNYVELGKETGAMNKQQAILYQLKAIKNAEYLAMLQTYEAATLFLTLLFILLILAEEAQTDLPQLKILSMFSFTDNLKQKIDSFHSAQLEKRQDKSFIVPTRVEEKLREKHIDLEKGGFNKGIQRRRKLSEKLEELRKEDGKPTG